MTVVNALVRRYDKIVKQIESEVIVTNLGTGQTVSTLGIWDTGATGSVITKSTANALGLTPITKTFVNGVHGSKEVNVYYVNITLNNDQITLNSLVTECEELSNDQSAGMLIGMNVISLGDFSITNFDGKTVMSFRRPSLGIVDFVKEINEFNKYLKIHNIWIKNNNQKCPCGSGKLWKNCHGAGPYI